MRQIYRIVAPAIGVMHINRTVPRRDARRLNLPRTRSVTDRSREIVDSSVPHYKRIHQSSPTTLLLGATEPWSWVGRRRLRGQPGRCPDRMRRSGRMKVDPRGARLNHHECPTNALPHPTTKKPSTETCAQVLSKKDRISTSSFGYNALSTSLPIKIFVCNNS